LRACGPCTIHNPPYRFILASNWRLNFLISAALAAACRKFNSPPKGGAIREDCRARTLCSKTGFPYSANREGGFILPLAGNDRQARELHPGCFHRGRLNDLHKTEVTITGNGPADSKSENNQGF